MSTGIKQVKDGCWTFGDGDKVCYPWANDTGGDGGGASGGETVVINNSEWKLIKKLTLTEDADTVVIDKDNNGNSFSLNECIIYIRAKVSTAGRIDYIPNGYWVSGAYMISEETAATDFPYSFGAHCFGKAGEYFWGYEIFSKGQPSGCNYNLRAETLSAKYSPITSFKLASKFAAGAEFILYGKESN